MTKRTVIALTEAQERLLRKVTHFTFNDWNIANLPLGSDGVMWERINDQLHGNYNKHERRAIIDQAEALERELQADQQDE